MIERNASRLDVDHIVEVGTIQVRKNSHLIVLALLRHPVR